MIEWFEEDFADFSDGILYDSSEFSNLIKGSSIINFIWYQKSDTKKQKLSFQKNIKY